MYLWRTVITVCTAVELLFLYTGVFLILCVVLVQDESYTIDISKLSLCLMTFPYLLLTSLALYCVGVPTE